MPERPLGVGAGIACSVRAPDAREQGAGDIGRAGVVPGELEIVSATQKSSNCRISR